MNHRIICENIKQKSKALLVLFYYGYSWNSGCTSVVPESMSYSDFKFELNLVFNPKTKKILQSKTDHTSYGEEVILSFDDFLEKEQEIFKGL